MNRLMFVLILSLFLDVGAYGQGTEEGPMLPEYLYAHLDRDLYVAGEQLWYSVYFLQPQDYLRSKVVHVEVLNPRGEVVAHNQHPVQGNAATGDIYLESSWNPGMYTLRVYTLWNQNFEPEFSFVRNLPIYNTQQVEEEEDSNSSAESLLAPNTDNSSLPFPTHEVKVEIPPSSLSPRDSLPVKCSLSGLPDSEYPIQFSVSVIKKEEDLAVIKSASMIQRKGSLVGLNEQRVTSDQLFPPQKNLVAWGKVEADPSESAVAFVLTDSTSVRFPQIAQGVFNVDFPDFYGEQTLQVFTEEGSAQLDWGSSQDLLTSKRNLTSLPYNPAIREAILKSRKRKLFQQVFELEDVARYPRTSPSRFSLNPDQRFLADDYIAFGSFLDFMRETVYIRVKGKEPNQSIRLLNQDRNLYFKDPPLFMVDGYITRDQEAVLDIPWREVERVELFLSSFRLLSQFASLGNYGVLAVYTKSGSPPPEIQRKYATRTIKGFQKTLVFSPPTLSSGDGEFPDLRTVEYWNPKLTLSKGEMTSFGFRLSDAKGVFILSLEGVTRQGTPVYGRVEFEVGE